MRIAVLLLILVVISLVHTQDELIRNVLKQPKPTPTPVPNCPPAVALPATVVDAVGGQCPGTPYVVDTDAPFRLELTPGLRFDYAYVKAGQKCYLVPPYGNGQCYSANRQNAKKVLVTTTGPKPACKAIGKVFFYATDCSQVQLTPPPTCEVCLCGSVGPQRNILIRGRNLRSLQAANEVCPVCLPCPPTPSPTPAPSTSAPLP